MGVKNWCQKVGVTKLVYKISVKNWCQICGVKNWRKKLV